jgi:hypothetical protein
MVIASQVLSAPSLSDRIYDVHCADTDTVIDRLCGVVQVLVQRQSRDVQLECLARLGQFPNPNQQELFS